MPAALTAATVKNRIKPAVAARQKRLFKKQHRFDTDDIHFSFFF
jgi:hypothetical protein